MGKLEWELCVVDSPGLWAFGGDSEKPSEKPCVFRIDENDLVGNPWKTPKWYCRLGDIPVIEMPKKKVTKRLWIKPTPFSVLDPSERNAVFMTQWIADECANITAVPPDWIRTDLTKEFEE